MGASVEATPPPQRSKGQNGYRKKKKKVQNIDKRQSKLEIGKITINSSETKR
jgi:hypothetical protein